MHHTSPEFKALLGREVTTLALCWQLKCRDGTVFAFTAADHGLLVDGLMHQPASGFLPSAVSASAGLGVDNMEMEGALESDSITEADILAGKYDHAAISVFLVDYLEPGAGKLMLHRGWIGEVQTSHNRFTAEMRGFMQAFTRNIGELYSPSCRTSFCDVRCGLDASRYTFVGQVQRVSGSTLFTADGLAQPDGYFTYGRLEFTSGNNAGRIMEIRSYHQGNIELMLPMPTSLNKGDSFLVTAGCDKRLGTCIDKFANAINFRGEPHVPLPEKFAG